MLNIHLEPRNRKVKIFTSDEVENEDVIDEPDDAHVGLGHCDGESSSRRIHGINQEFRFRRQ
jgi:hypothetical protein